MHHEIQGAALRCHDPTKDLRITWAVVFLQMFVMMQIHMYVY
jgi:hypothetical protein